MPNPIKILEQHEIDALLTAVNGYSSSLVEDDFERRLSNSVFLAWHILCHKAGKGATTATEEFNSVDVLIADGWVLD